MLARRQRGELDSFCHVGDHQPIAHRAVEDLRESRVNRVHRRRGRVLDSSDTHACTSVCRTFAIFTAPERGSTFLRQTPSAACMLVGFRCPRLRSSHSGPSSPIVVRPIDAEMFSPRCFFA